MTKAKSKEVNKLDTELLKAMELMIQKSLQPIHVELKQMNNRMDEFQGSLSQTNDRMDNFQGALAQMNDRMDNFQGSLTQMNDRMDNFEGTQSELLTRVNSIETELKDFRTETKTALRIIQDGQRGTRQEMTQRFNEVKRSFNHLESDVALIYQKTAKQELEINRIKNLQQ